MGIFSGILDAGKAILTGDWGAAAGGLLSGITGGLDQAVSSAASAAVPYFLTREGAERQNEMNALQAQMNRDWQERMWGNNVTANQSMMREGQAFNDYMWNQNVTANQNMAREQMGFQERMANSQFQRAVSDMKAAGLSPMLAYSQGGNAAPAGSAGFVGALGSTSGSSSTPSGAMARMENPLGQAVQSGFQAAKLNAELQNMREQNELLRAQARETDTRSLVNLEQVPYLSQQTKTSMATADNLVAHSALYSVQYNHVLRQIEHLALQMKLTDAETELVKEQAKNAVYTGTNIQANTANTKVNTVLSELEIPRAQNYADYAGTTLGRMSPFLDQAGSVIHSGAELARGGMFNRMYRRR